MNLSGRILSAVFLMAAGVGANAADSADTYSFFDEAMGLGIRLPKAWERRDPTDAKQQLVEANERYWRRKSEGVQQAGVLFVALARPYDGPARSRSTLSCAVGPVPPGSQMQPGDMGSFLERNVASMFDRHESNAKISPPAKMQISGLEAYSLSIDIQGDSPANARFIALLKDESIVQCFGIYDAQFREPAESALSSIEFFVSQPAKPLAGLYRKFGCEVPAFDATFYAADRDKGMDREEVIDLRVKISYPMRVAQHGALRQAQYREYVTHLVNDAYAHPSIATEDIAAYESYKCMSVLRNKEPQPLRFFAAGFSECADAKDRAACRANLLTPAGFEQN